MCVNVPLSVALAVAVPELVAVPEVVAVFEVDAVDVAPLVVAVAGGAVEDELNIFFRLNTLFTLSK